MAGRFDEKPALTDAAPSELIALYLSRRADLLRFFQARTGSAAAAEDLLQELYIKLSGAPPAEIENGAAYLYRAGLNLLLDKKRAEMRNQRRDRAYVDVHSGALGESDEPSPEDAAEARHRLDRLLSVVKTLPPQCQRVFRMHKLEGMTHEEVARSLGISRSAVEKHVITALKRLASVLNEGNGA